MDHSTEAFIGINVAKSRHAVAIADGERGVEVRYLGEVDASEESMRRLIRRIAAKHDRRVCRNICVADAAGDMRSSLSALRPESDPRTR